MWVLLQEQTKDSFVKKSKIRKTLTKSYDRYLVT